VPIYEYEPDDRECFICEGRVAAIQSIDEPPLKYCPSCGLEVCRVISRASFKISKPGGADKAAEKGFTTWRRAEKGTWEKVAGEGADYMVGSPADVKAVEEEKKAPAKIIDLDKGT
jgi:putative FmdB family regulatory protein